MPRFAVLLSVMLATTLLAASTAHADTRYGGTGLYKQTSPTNPSIALTRRDDGTILARASLAYRCRGTGNSSLVVQLRGKLSGAAFTATGRVRLRRVGTVRVTLTGTVAEASAVGKAQVRVGGCRRYTSPFVLRTASAPVGAPAVPAPGTLMQGLTGQSTGAFGLPLTLRVTKNGRVYALWGAVLRCGRGRFPLLDLTPSRKIRPDGTFGGSQAYVIRYNGADEHYRVTFRGQFLADGARGTFSARMQLRDGKRRAAPCRSGTQTWAARAT